jgi:DNA polymerase (family 10)
MKTSRNMTNQQIVKLLRAVAAALSLEKGGDNRFRIIAYERASDAIEHSSTEAKDLWDDGKLLELPGIGENIASYLDELFRTGKVRHFQSLLKNFPPALFELLEISGIGPVSAQKLCKALGLNKAHDAVNRLEKAAKSDHIAPIEGFGETSQAEILRSISDFRNRSRRMLLPAAQSIADSVMGWLVKNPFVKKADFLGSLRRRASTVGDIDISVSSPRPKEVIAHFISYPQKTRILEAGDATASILLPNDIQVDLMVQPPDAYGSLLQHFTGSKFHNIALRELALKKGLSLSEYGIRQLPSSEITKFPDEQSFYAFLGLQFIPPELRENNGEIEVALKNSLPDLVETRDIKGDLHLHSSIEVEPSHDSGVSTVRQMADAGTVLGYEYIGLTEHNPSVAGHTPDQILEILRRKKELIEQYNYPGDRTLYVFNGLEIDITSSGMLSVPEKALDLLDYACVGVHGSFRLSRKLMTDRVISALNHPQVKFLTHPTCRLLNEREGVEYDWDRLFDFCVRNNKCLEINAWPNRLDLPDTLVREAVKNKVKIIINTDSHDARDMGYMKFGISVARRGWLTKSDIINTGNLKSITRYLKGGEN